MCLTVRSNHSILIIRICLPLLLEWARKTREVGQYHLLENTGEEGTTSNVPINGDTPTNTNGTTPTLVNGSYDHLSPPTGYDKVINNNDEDAPIY